MHSNRRRTHQYRLQENFGEAWVNSSFYFNGRTLSRYKYNAGNSNFIVFKCGQAKPQPISSQLLVICLQEINEKRECVRGKSKNSCGNFPFFNLLKHTKAVA